ncbi:hypothetical protein C0Z01_10610 [Photobacterium kishitanii]|uniref:Uncharacterized protein n=1 Tax=Photobacterium kishitanii TaxID=318456 RepID=A0A0B7JC72_9GAMM|nr:hypothetical protein [Photobacterium kishitanii]OBU21725.1 hypothetical protein AYY22_08910 [Photobacterium kishitanii]PSU87913.1 hypothetical protein C9J27_25870 [Photobacterium kishitanii]PSU92164.1 hypothetical protein C0W42_01960 [Photobacterium kishitanii]PSU97000.1 hypothetical protein C0W35_01045 [Photobacterium kishitanii]PSV12355.1 hypothetical protein C0W28_18215 [Photobacterium kishitanii]
MNHFQSYSQLLPCFDCRKNTAEADLGWLTPAMYDSVQQQITAIITGDTAFGDDLTMIITCNPEDARDYLLLNAFGYTEDELISSGIDADDLQEIEQEIAASTTALGQVTFEHEIALQACDKCA